MYKDYHHDILFPSSMSPAEIIKRANAIWSQRGIRPKQHLSEPRPGAVTLMEKRAHSDRCENLPVDLPNDMGERRYSTFGKADIKDCSYLDLMIEVRESKI